MRSLPDGNEKLYLSEQMPLIRVKRPTSTLDDSHDCSF